MRILMIEDDRELCEACAPQLRAAGFEADFCHDGGEALYYLRQPIYDLCILDRMLPGSDGLALLASARAEGVRTPVLMLTAMGRVGDRVDGLDAGADDYLTKPFDMRELLARVRALARRPGTLAAPDLLCYGDLSLDRGSLALRGGKGACVLSKKEAEVLGALLQGGGRTLSRALLFGRVWGADTEVEEASLDSYIHFVRRRLAAVSERVRVATVRGVGYRLEDARDAP